MQNALSVNISMLVRALVQALGGVVMLFMTSAKLTVFILIIIPAKLPEARTMFILKTNAWENIVDQSLETVNERGRIMSNE